jgi:hypothetical protein
VRIAEGIRRFAGGRFEKLDSGAMGARLPADHRRSPSTQAATPGCATTNKGLFMWRNHKMTRFDEAPHVARRPCTYLLSDAQGRMWIGFTSGGLFALYERGAFRLYAVTDGLAEGQHRRR